MKKQFPKIVDVTGQVTFKQEFGDRIIDDSEYSNKTKYGYPLKLESVKVVDITGLIDFNPYLQQLREELKKENKKRSKTSTATRKWLSEKIQKIETGKFRVQLVYFWIEYKNKMFGQGPVKWIYHDHYCVFYIDGEVRTGNMQYYWQAMKPLKSNKDNFRETVKERLKNAYERDDLGIETDQIVGLMIKYAPRKKKLLQPVA